MTIVWTAVIATVSAVGAIVSAYLGQTDFTLALGLTGVVFALLASRER